MKEKKVRILLDDYGSGMSSLSTLESYEFDTIKLDIGFVRKIGQSDKAEKMYRMNWIGKLFPLFYDPENELHYIDSREEN